MRRTLQLLLLTPVVCLVACSTSEPPQLEGESVVVAQRGTGFTDVQRASDSAAGIETVEAPKTDEYGSTKPPAATDASAGEATFALGAIDPARAGNLNADPSALAVQKVANLVTFRQLTLEGVNIDALLDYLFTPTTERAQSFTFPDAIKALDGKESAVVGYMIPLEYKPKTDDIKVFMLVRDLMSCCFGGTPRPDEWIYVEMDGDRASKLFPYLPIVVRGKLKVGRIEDEFGLSSGVYSMKGLSVEEFKAE